MKNWGIFFGGVGTGIVLTFIFAIMFNYCSDGTPSGVKNFDKPGPVIHESSVKVFQVVAENAALVNGQDESYSHDNYLGPVYLLRNYDGKYYYDDEIIRKPVGCIFRQTGIYKYTAKSGTVKTVPIIEIQ